MKRVMLKCPVLGAEAVYSFVTVLLAHTQNEKTFLETLVYDLVAVYLELSFKDFERVKDVK